MEYIIRQDQKSYTFSVKNNSRGRKQTQTPIFRVKVVGGKISFVPVRSKKLQAFINSKLKKMRGVVKTENFTLTDFVKFTQGKSIAEYKDNFLNGAAS